IHKGWFAATLARSPVSDVVRVVFIDCDSAKGTQEVLLGVVPSLAGDGVVFSQDFHIAPVRELLLDPGTWERYGRGGPSLERLCGHLAMLRWRRHSERRVLADRRRSAERRVAGRRLAARRYRWLVFGVTLLGTAAGIGLSLLLPPTYLARATVWVQVPSGHARDARDRGPIWQGQLPISSGWMDLLQTNVVLEDVVRRHRLYLTPRQPGDTDALATFGIKPHVRPALYRLVVDSIGKTFTLADKKHLVQLHGTVGDSIGAEL